MDVGAGSGILSFFAVQVTNPKSFQLLSLIFDL
jgi:predicted RNA methylase